ncbi:GntR family transcriptional regulator [Nocardiopsis sp. SBT366]|uniref:GntR family transcriptional regulator n=1 Tax=Nocardiopsis sp. SBT366 TaxID=1580529 RepID=UPI00066D97A3|nr:GntR family transcriptional regulator [Nocardiopsis sp. SBT366]
MDAEDGLSPYERIVADIRADIDSGELPPGCRVPSTREITRRWGVAMATATKALSVLRREGRVEALRGVGTVVSRAPALGEAAPGTENGPATDPSSDREPGPRADREPEHPAGPRVARERGTREPRERPRSTPRVERGPHPESGLTREGIVLAAIAVADAEGLEGLSMRRVSVELGVSTMALYRHVASKGELLTEIVDHLFTVHALAEPPPSDWREAFEVALVREWEIYRRHPWAARLTVMAGGVVTPALLRNGEWMMRVIVAQGRTPDEALEILTIVSAYTSGMALQATRVALEEHEHDMDAEHWWRSRFPLFQRFAAEGRFPTMLSVSGPPDVNGMFASGMRRLLDGLTPWMEGTGAP